MLIFVGRAKTSLREMSEVLNAAAALVKFLRTRVRPGPYWVPKHVVFVLLFMDRNVVRAAGTMNTSTGVQVYDWLQFEFRHQYVADLYNSNNFAEYVRFPGDFTVKCVEVVQVEDTAYAFYMVVKGRADVGKLHGLNLTHGQVGDFHTGDGRKINMGPVASVLLD